MPCKRDSIGPGTPESDPRMRSHRQVKAVCFATHLRQPNGFLEVPEASVVAVSRTLQVAVSSLANA
jgi:glutamine amidotransferase